METVKQKVARLSRRVVQASQPLTLRPWGRKWVWKSADTVQNHKRGGNSVEVGCGASDKAHVAALTRANRSVSEHCSVSMARKIELSMGFQDSHG